MLWARGKVSLNCKLLENYDLYTTYTAHRFFHPELPEGNSGGNQQVLRERVSETGWCLPKTLTAIIIIIITVCSSRRKKADDFVSILAFIRRVHQESGNNNREDRRNGVKVFCEDKDGGEAEKEMTIINLIRISSDEGSLSAKNFGGDDDCSLIFRERVFFDAYLFDIAWLMTSSYSRIRFITSFISDKFRHMSDLDSYSFHLTRYFVSRFAVSRRLMIFSSTYDLTCLISSFT